MEESTREELREYFREDIQELSRITGRDLQAWLT